MRTTTPPPWHSTRNDNHHHHHHQWISSRWKSCQTSGQAEVGYIRSLVLCWTWKIHWNISLIPPLNFTGVKNSKILARFSTPVAFDGLWLANGGTYQKLLLPHWVTMIEFRSDWDILLTSPLILVRVDQRVVNSETATCHVCKLKFVLKAQMTVVRKLQIWYIVWLILLRELRISICRNSIHWNT